MNKKKLFIALASLLIAIGVVAIQFFYFSRSQEQEVSVLVAKKYIPSGTLITDDLFEVKNISQNDYIQEMVSSIGNVTAYAKVDIPKGTYLLTNMVDKKNIPDLKDGQAKVTIKVDLYSSLAGKIKIGDTVDVGFVPSEDGSNSSIVAEKLTIVDITDEKGANIRNTSENAYDKDVLIPAAVTFITNSRDQALMLKDKEKEGTLFIIGY